MKHKLSISLCSMLGWYNLSSAQGSSLCDTTFDHTEYPDDKLCSGNESGHMLSQSIFTTPYILPDGESVFLPSKKEDKELKQLKSKYFSLSLPLPHIRVTSRFGMRFHPVLKERRNHLGVDLRAYFQPTYAMMAGKVERIGSDSAAGKFVVCNHGNFTVYYYHLSEIKVKEGQLLKAGDVIGITGNTGRSTGAHLHLGVQMSGKYIDPMSLLFKIQRTKIGLLRKIVELSRRKDR